MSTKKLTRGCFSDVRHLRTPAPNRKGNLRNIGGLFLYHFKSWPNMIPCSEKVKGNLPREQALAKNVGVCQNLSVFSTTHVNYEGNWRLSMTEKAGNHMALDDHKTELDRQFDFNGLKVLVNLRTLMYPEGITCGLPGRLDGRRLSVPPSQGPAILRVRFLLCVLSPNSTMSYSIIGPEGFLARANRHNWSRFGLKTS